jgi:hypothetical protein
VCQNIRVGTQVRSRDEHRQRLRVAVDNASPIDNQRGDAWRSAIAAPCDDGGRAGGWLCRKNDPQDMRGSSGETRSGMNQNVPERCSTVDLDQQCAEGTRSVGHSGLRAVVEAERSQKGIVEWSGTLAASERAGDSA